MFGFTRRRRERLRRRPLPTAWRDIIDRNVPYVRLLTDDERRELFGHIQVFLAEKTFEGREGLEITDEVRVTIAAQACMLLLNRETRYYPTLKKIFVYPDAYIVRMTRRLPDGTVIEEAQNRLGESWHRGSVALSWDDSLRGAADIDDGHNLVWHEFAHQLDAEAGASDGAPELRPRSRYATWARVLGAEYEQLQTDLERHRKTLIDSYAATNPAEFFAVVTETFFERPRALAKKHPELYEQLAQFYRQDPAVRMDEKRGAD